MSISQLTGSQLVVLFCSSIPVLLFDNPKLSKYHNTLVLMSPHIYFIAGFICALFVARNDLCLS